MPLGLFLIKWDPLQGPGIFAKSSVKDYELNQDQVNQVFMSHASGKKPVERMVMQVDELSILSRFLERKENNTVQRCLLILILNKGEKPDDFDSILKDLEPKIWENISKSQLKVNILINDAFKNMKEELTATLDAEVIKKRVIKRAQNLLDENKINEAQALLARSKNLPQQLVKAAKDGFNLRLEKKYEKSVKSYEDAQKYAKMLQEPELADEFEANARRSEEIPVLEKKREKTLNSAREHMKREEFLEAAKEFKVAGELSDKLGDIVGKEINLKKHDILNQYSELDGLAD